MRDDEIREASALIGVAAQEVARGVQRIHGAIAARARGALRLAVGESVAPLGFASRGVTKLTYAAVDVGLFGASRVGGLVWTRARADDEPAGDAAGRLLAVVNGTHGHVLEGRRSPLALPTTVRRDGSDIDVTPEAVRAAWPDAGSEIAVYVHGLVFSEREWNDATGGVDAAGERILRDGRVSFPQLLADELGLTPVTVRYNTGRRIEHSGRDLFLLLGDLVATWPVPVTRVVLIGHSMGGLVSRFALAEAGNGDGDWRELVTDLVTLGSPHEGSWLEQAVVRLGPHLRRVPETAWFGELLDSRSDGIRDLVGIPIGKPGKHVRERAIVATIAGSGRVGRAFGDMLVGTDSARGELPDDDVTVIDGLHHMALLHDPRAGQQLVDWLRGRPVSTRGPGPRLRE